MLRARVLTGQSAPARHRVRPAGGRRRSSRSTSAAPASRTGSRSVPGDFFKEPLPKADVVLMGHILHDWDLPTKKMLIKKAFDALPRGGALVVYEAIIDDDRSKNAFGLMMSLNMLIETPGGFDYTGADCAGWMKEAGFSSDARRAARRAGLDGRSASSRLKELISGIQFPAHANGRPK